MFYADILERCQKKRCRNTYCLILQIICSVFFYINGVVLKKKSMRLILRIFFFKYNFIRFDVFFSEIDKTSYSELEKNISYLKSSKKLNPKVAIQLHNGNWHEKSDELKNLLKFSFSFFNILSIFAVSPNE